VLKPILAQGKFRRAGLPDAILIEVRHADHGTPTCVQKYWPCGYRNPARRRKVALYIRKSKRQNVYELGIWPGQTRESDYRFTPRSQELPDDAVRNGRKPKGKNLAQFQCIAGTRMTGKPAIDTDFVRYGTLRPDDF